VSTDRYARPFDREAWSRRVDEVRARVAMSRVVESIFKVKLTKASSHEWTMLCPYHSEKTPSFTVNDKKGFCHCFGCGAHYDAVKLVMKHQGLGFQATVELLESQNGITNLKAATPAPPKPAAQQAEDVDKAKAVERIWKETVEIRVGSVVDRFLRGRGLLPPAEYGFGDAAVNAGWPVDLRFAAELWHGQEKCRMPGMVAAMRKPDGRLSAVHRTYLKVTGVAVTAAGTKRDKAMYGDVRGAFIRLAEDQTRMLGGEGIVTSLSAMQLFRRAGIAFGTAGAMERIEPPFVCDDFLYAADWEAESRVGERSAWKGAKKFGTGRRVVVKVPMLSRRGHDKADFNDELQAAASVPAAPASTAGGRPPPAGQPQRRRSVSPGVVDKQPAVLPPSECIAADRQALHDERRLAKAAEREAWLAYAAAEDAVVAAIAGSPEWTASRVAMQQAKAAWSEACARTRQLLERRVA
jgi:hypothetical protein